MLLNRASRRSFNLALVAALVAGVTLASGGVAIAYNNLDPECHWNNTTPLPVLYKFGPNLQTPGTQWRTAFNNAVGYWNVANIKPAFAYDASNSRNTLDTYSAADGFAGYAWWYCNVLYYLDRFDAKGNVNYSRTNQEADEVAAQETGHGLGLGHSTVSPAVMNVPYGTWGVPQPDDVNGVNSMYP